MREGRQHACDEQRLISRAKRRHGIADDEERHQAEQQRLALDAAGERGQDRRAEGDAKRIDADDETGERQGDVEVVGDCRQQTDDDEFRGSDRIGRDRQCKKSKWHEMTQSITHPRLRALVLVRAEYG